MEIDSSTTRWIPPGTKWAVYAGLYTFASSTLLLLVVGPLSGTLGTVLGISTHLAPVILAAPVPFIGATVWWGIVERRDRYTYHRGGLFGLSTAFLNVVFWLLVLSAVWGVSMVMAGALLVVFVLVVFLPTGFLVGLPLMLARRRVAGEFS